MLEEIAEFRVVAPLLIEGITTNHQAMRGAKAIGASIRKLRDYLECQTEMAEEVEVAPRLSIVTEDE